MFFKKKYNIDILPGHEVLSIHPIKKELTIKNLFTGEILNDHYDKLIIATGATSFKSNVHGIEKDNVFFLRNVQSARKIKTFIEERKPKNAVIVGTGFIGFELLENLMGEGINVTIIEKQNKITPNLDDDMAAYLETSIIKI